MKVAFFDCFAGVSGDMALGALIDAGVSVSDLLEGLRSLPLDGWDLQVSRTRKGPLAATSVTVAITKPQPHERHLPEIESLIAASDLPEKVKAKSKTVFRLLAEAEAKVHGIEIEKVHFHEVGAVDSIVDIVGTVFALHLLGVEIVHASALPFSRGRVQTDHGELPVPAPATMELLRGVPTYPLAVEAELVTPTGIALLKGLANSFGMPPPFTPQQIGYGAGKRELPFPNVLRVVIGEVVASPEGLERERLTIVETNLDDMSGELAGFVLEQLLEVGARDVWLTPAQMKKNRPAIVLSVLCDGERLPKVLDILLQETTSLGVRVREVERLCLPREVVEVATPYGAVRVKVAKWGDRIVNIAPEYEDCRRLSKQQKVSLKEVMAAAMAAARQLLLSVT